MEPKSAKGGTFSTQDIKLLKEVLPELIRIKQLEYSASKSNELANLLHRLNRIETN